MKSFYCLLLFFCFICNAQQQTVPLSYFLPQNDAYNENIPTPKSIFNFELGEMHTDHNQVIYFMEAIAKASDRVQIATTGHTYENRPLQLLTISSPENLAKIDEIHKKHLAFTDSNINTQDVSDLPIVIYLGYSIHGNEFSGTGAAIALAYYLAASESPELKKNVGQYDHFIGSQFKSRWITSFFYLGKQP